MVDPLGSLRSLVHSPSDAVRWACLLEATAPKVGNVYPGCNFENLSFGDFVAAAEIAAKSLGQSNRRISERMRLAVDETVSLTKTNVNLGIVLLLGPLVGADESLTQSATDERTNQAWLTAIGDLLGELDGVDGQNIFCAISRAGAGGLGKVETMDVHDTGREVDILNAMQLAQDRDRIARQYASGFLDLIETVVPVVRESIESRGDLLSGISLAHLQLLRMEPDSLIARKNSIEVALSVQSLVQKVDVNNPASIAELDDFLRSFGHPLNPGTTADLIAAALYLLLRTRRQA